MSADLALLAADPSQVESFSDPAAGVMAAMERAKGWLTWALDHGSIEEIVECKSQAEAVRVYTAQKQIGKDAELAAAEVVRRAERGIGLAIRKGQEAGEIVKRGDIGVAAEGRSRGNDLPRPTDYAPLHELQHAAYPLAEASTEQFEAAVREAKGEGSLSRSNVLRKVRALKGSEMVDTTTGEIVKPRNVPAEQRLIQIRTLAAKSMSSGQIGDRIGVSAERVRKLARENEIDIPADRIRGVNKRIDPNRVIDELVIDLASNETAINLIRFGDIDPANVNGWVASIEKSIQSLRSLKNQLKELTQP